MHKVALLVLTCLTFTYQPAIAEILTCDTLRARVDAKLQAKGIPSYTLEIVTAGTNVTTQAASAVHATNAGKQVGTCNGGTKHLIYTRGN